jgi:hypothetical protein
LKISSGIGEEAELEALIHWVSVHRAKAREFGLRASKYVSEVHSLDRIVELYTAALK